VHNDHGVVDIQCYLSKNIIGSGLTEPNQKCYYLPVKDGAISRRNGNKEKKKMEGTFPRKILK